MSSQSEAHTAAHPHVVLQLTIARTMLKQEDGPVPLALVF